MTPLFALLFDSLDERLRLRKPGRKVVNKVFPEHWAFLLGEVSLFSFIVLVLTGIFLTMFYTPSVDAVTYTGEDPLYRGQVLPAAFESVVRLSFDVEGGLLFRRIHRGASHLFVASIVLHMLRVILTGAFRRPREINYHIGIVLLLLSFASGFTGQSLPYDLLAGTGIRIAYTELLSTPFIGDRLAFWVFGGDFPGTDVIPRFFAFHVLALPGLIVAVMTLHLAIIARQTHTQFPSARVDGHRQVLGKPLWPSQFHVSTTLVLWLGGLLTLAAVLVPWSDEALVAPYLVGDITNQAQPEWFLFWLEGALRIFPPVEFSLLGMTISGPFVAGALFPALIIAVLVAYPTIEKRFYGLQGDWHVLQNPLEIPLRAAFASGFFGFLLLMAAAATNDILSNLTGIPIETITWFFRIASPVLPAAAAVLLYRYSSARLRRAGLQVARVEATADTAPGVAATGE
ncbi:MAG: cytochrome b N-terminal domain-containing protein [Actinomycetota bacterium]|nr:cytochrome b N-terminal domain-containing protein [Actinomycetota bacterium]